MTIEKKKIKEQKKGDAKQKAILLAEDDRFLIKVLSDKLEHKGYDVTLAIDGVEALEKLKKGKFDLMLLDLIMPNKDGFEVLEELKKSKTLKKVPIVILSNLGQDSDIEKGKALGATDYLIKSNLGINEVVEKIKKFLK
ncbi:MAG: response regulator [Candidatus Magasanikbacteria bacterium]